MAYKYSGFYQCFDPLSAKNERKLENRKAELNIHCATRIYIMPQVMIKSLLTS